MIQRLALLLKIIGSLFNLLSTAPKRKHLLLNFKVRFKSCNIKLIRADASFL